MPGTNAWHSHGAASGVDGLHAAPGVGVERFERAAVERRRGVDEHVDTAMAVEDAGGGTFEIALVGEVDRIVAGAVEADRGVASGGERRDDRAADRAGAAGDDGEPMGVGRCGHHRGITAEVAESRPFGRSQNGTRCASQRGRRHA
jgi:hypothetical protein